MNDPEIRDLLAPKLAQYAAVVGELCIGNTIGDMTRADLVGLTHERLHGFELKGDNDTLKRVPLQLSCYQRAFSRVTFVVTEKHASKILLLLPDHVGLWVVYEGEIAEYRSATSHAGQDYDLLAGLLWGEELRELLKRHGIQAKAKWRVWESRSEIAKCPTISLTVLEAFVAGCLLSRMKGKLARRAKAKQQRQAYS